MPSLDIWCIAECVAESELNVWSYVTLKKNGPERNGVELFYVMTINIYYQDRFQA